MNCTEIQKEDAAVIRWLHAGTSSNSARPALEGLSVEGDIMVAANGFQLRIASTPESLKEFDGKLIRLDKTPRASGDVVKTHLIEDSKFPDWQGIIPTSKPTYKIGVNAGWLANLITGMGETIEFTFYGTGEPIVIKSDDKYALLMPVHASDSVDRFDPTESPLQLEESNQDDTTG